MLHHSKNILFAEILWCYKIDIIYSMVYVFSIIMSHRICYHAFINSSYQLTFKNHKSKHINYSFKILSYLYMYNQSVLQTHLSVPSFNWCLASNIVLVPLEATSVLCTSGASHLISYTPKHCSARYINACKVCISINQNVH